MDPTFWYIGLPFGLVYWLVLVAIFIGAFDEE